MQENSRRALRGVAWVGRAARFCLGLLAVLALIVVMTVLTAVMLTATILPPASVGRRKSLGRLGAAQGGGSEGAAGTARIEHAKV